MTVWAPAAFRAFVAGPGKRVNRFEGTRIDAPLSRLIRLAGLASIQFG
jgi:hypothetical protein